MKLSLLAATAAAALVLAPAAGAGPLDDAVAALRADPVYVDPAAQLAIPPADATRLRRKIDTAAGLTG